jgi:hypothetical protein
MTGLEEDYLTALTLWPTLLNPSREGGRSTLTSGNPANGLHTTRIGKLPFRTYRLKLVSHNVSATNLINNIAEKAEKVKLDICPLMAGNGQSGHHSRVSFCITITCRFASQWGVAFGFSLQPGLY